MNPSTFGVGSWRPATLTTTDIVVIKAILAVSALARSVDYGTSATSMTGSAGIEQSLPAWLWALMCGTVGVLIVSGMACRVHTVVWAGHFLGAITYLALAVGAVQYTITLVPPDEWRRIGPLLVITMLHIMFALRSGPRPLDRDVESTVERVVGPQQ